LKPASYAFGDALDRLDAGRSRDDVLARFLQPLTGTMAEVVVRATADYPAMDIDAARRALAAQDASGVEAIRTSALIAAAARATALDDREHVTTFIRRRPAEYRVIEPRVPTALRRPDLWLTVDTEQDLAFLRAVADDLSVPLAAAPLADTIAAADRVCARPVR
jgi:spore coat polysaccharide biosynthesis protein SpsF